MTAAAGLTALALWAGWSALAARPSGHARHRPPARPPSRRRRGEGLPEVVELVAAALRSGRSLAEGLRSAAVSADPPLDVELAAVVSRADRGLPVAEAVARWGRSADHPDAGLVAAAVGLSTGTGGDVAQALVGVASTLRERRSLEREIRALSAQARASAAVVALAPAVFTTVAASADPTTGRFLVASPAGWACLAAGAALDVAGWRWMRRIAGSVR